MIPQITLPPPLAVLLVLLAAGLTGALLLSLWRKRAGGDPVEFIFAAVSLGLLLIGWLALVLAEFGRFSLGALGGLWIGITGVLLAVRLARAREVKQPAGPEPRNRWELFALLLWLVIAGVFYFRPHEFIIGGADAGVYVNLGANIAKTGGILIQDPLLGALDPALRPALLRAMPAGEAAPYYLLPGFYVTGAPADLVTPQFFHLHPAWQAVGYALGGLPAELWITPLWGLLGCLAVYMTARAWLGWRPALLALVLLSATGLQVWFARYPTAEALTQYLFWLGAWALGQWFTAKAPRGLWAMIAGAALGEVFLVRIDAYALFALPFILALWFTASRTWRREALWFFAPFLLLAGHSIAHAVFITKPYASVILGATTRVFTGAGPQRVVVAAVFAVMVVAVLAWLFLRRSDNLRNRARAVLIRVRPAGLYAAAGVVVALALFAYFIRPHLGEITVGNYWYGGGALPNLNRENFVRLGWYLSPLGLALGIGGIALMIVRGLNRRTAFVLIAGGFFSLIYLWRIGANPHQVYAMRRYVPQVLPFFVMGGAFLLWEIYRARRTVGRWAAIGLTAIWITGIVLPNQVLFRQVDYQGLAEQISRLNAALPRNAVVLFNDASAVGVADFVGTPLRFLYGRPVFLLRQANIDGTALTKAITTWRASGYEVVLLETSAGQPWPLPSDTLGAPAYQVLTFDNLENTYESKPVRVLNGEWRLAIRLVESARGSE